MCAALLVTVWVVQQVSHGEEGVIEHIAWNSPVLSIDQQHPPQERHKLPPVGFLGLHITVVGDEHQVHLMMMMTTAVKDQKRGAQEQCKARI